MNLFRAAVFFAAALLLGGGYLASQSAYLASQRPESLDATQRYIAALDSSPVPVLALLILVSCVVLACLPQEEPE